MSESVGTESLLAVVGFGLTFFMLIFHRQKIVQQWRQCYMLQGRFYSACVESTDFKTGDIDRFTVLSCNFLQTEHQTGNIQV